MAAQPPKTLEPVADNVRSIVELEERSHRERSRKERISDRITTAAGTLGFISFQLAASAAWMVWNALAPAALRFDPYPYGLLTIIVSLEAMLIATFVLITQNRMSRQSDARDHLNLQIDLLSEQELTLLLRLVRRIADHLGVAPPPDSEADAAEKLAAETDVGTLMRTLERELPSAGSGRSAPVRDRDD